MSLHVVDGSNNDVGDGLPLQLYESATPPDSAGVVQQAGRQHSNTVFKLQPVAVTKGKKYSFSVKNEEPEAVLAISLNTRE